MYSLTRGIKMGVVRYIPKGDRLAWKSSIPISAAECIDQPGSVNAGGTWHRAHPVCSF